MPELDILHGFEYITKRLQRQWTQKHKAPFKASLQIFPRVFALGTRGANGRKDGGTKGKDYQSCTVETSSSLFDYVDNLEPCPENYQANSHDVARSKNEEYARYVKPLQPGELFVKTRGKEIIFAAGYHAVRVHFGLEGTIVIVPTSAYHELISKDAPGNSTTKHRANKMRSFVVPPELTTPGARKLSKGSMQTAAVFAAVVGQEDTILITDHNRLTRLHMMSRSSHWTADDLDKVSVYWPFLWSHNHGPDWIYETDDALKNLDQWREIVLQTLSAAPHQEPAGCDGTDKQQQGEPGPDEEGDASLDSNSDEDEHEGALGDLALLVKTIRSTRSILQALLHTQQVYNGYGAHTAMDLLHRLGIWPGMPLFEFCSNDELYSLLRDILPVDASQYVSPTYRTRCLSLPNREAAFAFNYKSDINFVNQFLKVYRKCSVKMSREQYNMYVKNGLFNPSHTIGAPYAYTDAELLSDDEVEYKMMPVFRYEDGDVMYSAIQARRPSHWRGAASIPGVPDDVRAAGFKTTIGPASFNVFKNNQYDWKLVEVKPGRKAVERTGKRGRPARKTPHAQSLERLANRGPKAKEAVASVLRKTFGLEPGTDDDGSGADGYGDSDKEDGNDTSVHQAAYPSAANNICQGQPLTKRRRVSKAYVQPTDRVTRQSSGVAAVPGVQ
ncbi:uncharacterized protein TRAVEDRAFT_71124 [Trametes versicolor FP-101664 SS1]|uniref:uncharacterized protein n=1 Tax=Trametes versicolor (strain FP-101664) TaxID=717944 RepID=UPI00046239EE|nr:uncharacterized protein TRAVEDRAFT_71124 [Trametes versicolor FP-101664 SS1]EIW60877.1 hypothetical protein TRAVEDRAFT_71124 [Trametes versicolor FP-101664 SS1]